MPFSQSDLWQELRIHIPWTQLLSQPIEVKLYTIELILVSRTEAERVARRSSRTTSLDSIPAYAPRRPFLWVMIRASIDGILYVCHVKIDS